MIRTIVTELGLFLLPFAIYAGFLYATRAGLLHPESWPMKRVVALTAAAIVFAIAGFVLIADFNSISPGSTYIPAHIENGKFVPGATK
jgi:hypothetical protein